MLNVEVVVDVAYLAEQFAALTDDAQAQFLCLAAEKIGKAADDQAHYIGSHLRDCYCSSGAGRAFVRNIVGSMDVLMTAPDAAIAGLNLALATIEDIPREPHERLSASRSSPADHYSAGSADGFNRGLQAALAALDAHRRSRAEGAPK